MTFGRREGAAKAGEGHRHDGPEDPSNPAWNRGPAPGGALLPLVGFWFGWALRQRDAFFA